MTRTLFAALASAALATTLALPAHAQPKPKTGGTLTIGTEADPSSIDPLRIGSYVERQYALVVFDTLMDVDASGKVVPHLASSLIASPDGKNYVVKLRPNVKFHDGTPLDADAVVFNLNRVRDPANTCRCLGNVAAIAEVKALDKLTVQILMKSPYASFPAILADTPGMMASPTAIKANPTGFGNAPVGTGPFKLVEWTKGSRLVAERNPDYWRAGYPRVDKVVLRGLQNSETREATMVSGALDILTQPPPKFTAQTKRDKKFTVLEPKGLGTMFIALNPKNPALADVNVRRAIAHATNRELIIKAIYQGQMVPATTPFGAGLPGLTQVKDYPAYDLPKAQALIKAYGKPVKVNLQADNTPVALMTIQALQQMWQKAGIEVELKQFDQARLVQNMLSHDFETALFRWSGRPDPDLNVYGFFHSSGADRKVSSNYGQYKFPELDKLLDAGREELDPEKRPAIYNQVSAVLAKELPYVFISQIVAPIITKPNVRGVPLVPDSLVRVAEIWKD